ncbi:Choline-phosphate cytidylyltransferase B [Leucoagaricus sp. SymC.cos]|nr:Choline-phosphate cytidylyltransferase B [Leucoagaricus sp. SymC.cos]
MEATLSDDDYDVVSNPGDLSLDASVGDLHARNLTVWEPQPCPASSNKIPAIKWTAAEIQEYVRKVAGERCTGVNKVFRIYVDGCFDTFTASHALQLRQAKLSFPEVQLFVGVFSDQTIRQHNYEPSISEEERYELVRHCRWVDEIIPDAPWKLDDDFLRKNLVDFVAIEEGASVNPTYDKIRVIGYDEVKRLGKAIPTRRIVGVQQPLGPRSNSPTPSTASPSTPRPPSPPEDFTNRLHLGCAL